MKSQVNSKYISLYLFLEKQLGYICVVVNIHSLDRFILRMDAETIQEQEEEVCAVLIQIILLFLCKTTL